MVLTLSRTTSDSWTITLDAVPTTNFAEWQGLAETGCRAAGLTVAQRLQQPAEQVPEESASVPQPRTTPRPATSQDTTTATSAADNRVPPLDPSIYAIPNPTPWRTTPRTETRRRADELIDQIWPDGISMPRWESLHSDVDTYLDLLDAQRPTPFPPPPARTGWPALDDNEIVDLATRLRSLVWSWRMDDTLGLMAAFGWTVRKFEPDRITLDTKLATADGYMLGDGSQADCIDVVVTGPTTDDQAGRTRLEDTFARMTTALTDSLGGPTERIFGDVPRIRWAGQETVLTLTHEPPYIHLLLTQL
ncbi:DUF6301 family protein [Nocardia transvalensis]|uniref:DUF6301 family protein n=1 Tax=Nocardia transvalensis TaxID=37333 RepID=UPI001895E0CC|nr:DUF6301 family protein [Nocardia transvalensis]MBF6332784.1 hypothetical protein [Nocardia transvalensis]